MENLLHFLPENYLLIVLVIVFSGFIRGFLGFGSGLITIPILSYLYSPVFAMVFNIAIEIPATIYLTYVGAKSCKFKEISPMFFAMMLTIPIGTIFLVSVNEQLIKIIMSIFVIFFVVLISTGWKFKATVTNYVLTIGGVISGLMQGVTGMGGPPYATILLSKGDNDEVTRGNILIMSTGIVISAIISFYMFNLFTKELLLTGLITSPIYIFATYTGTKFFDLSGNKYYRNISLFSLGLIGILTLIKAIF
jgi:uncharacterized membrane protein YfcA